MQVRFTPPPVTPSPLGRLDARWRLAALLVAIVAVAVLRGVVAAALALAGAFVLAALARMPWRWYGLRLPVELRRLQTFSKSWAITV